MRVKQTSEGRTVVAISGKHAVCLALDWPQTELSDLLGFAIKRTGSDGSEIWLPNALRFEGEALHKGRLYDSSDAPIQSLIWGDFGITADPKKHGLPTATVFTYTVIPVRGGPGSVRLELDESVSIGITTEPEHDAGSDQPEVHFNRGLSDSQEYARLFGEEHQPGDDPQALDWLARDLDRNIIRFIDQTGNSGDMLLDVAAYHLDHPGVIESICGLGKRARVSLDWGADEKDESSPGPNADALKQLLDADVFVHKREHVSISHNKYIVRKKADGTPFAVLTGSTNFTNGGISSQSNQSVIIHNPALAAAYLADFDRVLENDNEGLRESNRAGTIIDDTLEVYFSPHSASDRPDLDRLTQLASQASVSRLFMTFRMTDNSLIEAVLDDSLPVFGVVDRAYRGNDDSGDRVLFDAAHESHPKVVSCAAPLSDEPEEDALFAELKRDLYNPIVHHKILLFDWDQPDCVVVTGSANYSTNSTAHNDENSLIVHGDQRLAEEYFVEFCRLFTHWRPRWLRERESKSHPAEHLAGDSSWTESWLHGSTMADFLAVALGRTGDTS